MTVLVENWNYLVVICLMMGGLFIVISQNNLCLLYTSPSPRDRSLSRMPSSA